MTEETAAIPKTYDDLDAYVASLTDEEREQLAIAEASFDLVDAAPAEESPETSADPTCSQCGKELDWRDLAYGGKAKEATDDAPAIGPTCKRCHAKAGKQAVKGRFAPMLVNGMQDGKPVQRIVIGNRSRRRFDTRHPAPPEPQRPRYVPGVRFAEREPALDGESETTETPDLVAVSA